LRLPPPRRNAERGQTYAIEQRHPLLGTTELSVKGQVEVSGAGQRDHAHCRSTVLDRLLAGPGFLDAGSFPEVSFLSELLVWVPAGWRAAGRLQVKNAEHELACLLDLQVGAPRPGDKPGAVITSSWGVGNGTDGFVWIGCAP
jgi:hypothetical protein